MENAKQTLISFLEAWKRKDYQAMFDRTQLTWKKVNNFDLLVSMFENINLKSFEINNSVIIGVRRKFTVKILVKIKGKEFEMNNDCVNVIPELKPYKPSEKGTFGVNPISLLRV